MMRIVGEGRSSFGLACWQGATQGMVAAHRHDDLEFNLSDVDLEYVIDGRSHLIPAGVVAVFWAARPHQLVGGVGAGVETWLTLPLQQALAWRLPTGFLQRMLEGEVVGITSDTGLRLDESVVRWRAELDGEALDRRLAETEIEAFTLRVARRFAEAAPLGDAPSAADRSLPRAAAAAMAAYISAHSAQDISVKDVAAHVGLNSQYAMSIFRGALGVTVGDYLAQCRVASAQQLLLLSDRSVPDAGFAAGFQSLSQFYDRFTRWCGESPGRYRRRLQAV